MKQLYYGMTLIDGTGGSPLENAGMMVENGSIVHIGQAADFSQDDGMQKTDCRGKTIIPGLINCHVHLVEEPYTWDRQKDTSETQLALRGAKHLRLLLESGVTFVRDLGSAQGVNIQLKKAIEDELIFGPDILSSGQPLCITGGHGWFWMSRQCDGQDEFVKGAREQIRAGADLLKVMSTGGYARPKMKINHDIMPDSPQMTVEEIQAVAVEAHRRGKKVAAHCNGLTGVRRAVVAGVDSIEHGQFNDVQEKGVRTTLDMMADKGIVLVPTLSAFFKNYVKAEVIGQYQAVLNSFTAALASGVKIAMGNDSGCPFVGHETAAMEIRHMVEAGMGPMAAISAATQEAAALLGILGSFGTLQTGKNADFLILKDTPLTDIGTLSDIDQVYKSGQRVSNTGLYQCNRIFVQPFSDTF
jgi:imidazolonepropionase-like amidohydrolase